MGVYSGTAGEAKTTIAVAAETFEATAYTPLPAAGRGAARAAATADAAVTWWTFAGTTVVSADRTVTLKVATVRHGGRSLEGSELARYTACTITAPIGEALGERLLAALMKCLGVTEAVEVERVRSSIIGTWELVAIRPGDGTELRQGHPGFPALTFEFSATELRTSGYTVICDVVAGAAHAAGSRTRDMSECRREPNKARYPVVQIEETAIVLEVVVVPGTPGEPGPLGESSLSSRQVRETVTQRTQRERLSYVLTDDGQRLTMQWATTTGLFDRVRTR